MNVAPARTRATRWGALTARQRSCADSMSLKAIASPAAREPGPLVILVRCRTVAKVDSIGLVVRTKVHPVLGGIVVEREQLVQVTGDLRGGLGELGAVCGFEGVRGGAGVVFVLDVPDLRQGLLRSRVRRLRQRREHVRGLVKPAATLPGLGEDLPQPGPEAQRPVAHGQHRGAHAAAGAVAQQISPRLGGLAVPVNQGDEFLAPVGAHPDHHQQAQLVLLEADIHVDAVGPQVRIVQLAVPEELLSGARSGRSRR